MMPNSQQSQQSSQTTESPGQLEGNQQGDNIELIQGENNHPAQAIKQIGIYMSYLDTSNIKYKLAQNLTGHSTQIRGLAISNDEKYIASGGNGGKEVFLWDLQSRAILKKYEGPSDAIYTLTFSRTNSRLAAAGANPFTIFIFNIRDLAKNDPIRVLMGHEHSIYRIIFSCNYLVSSSHDKSVRVWDVDVQKEVSKKLCEGNVYGLCLSDDDQMIGCCCFGGQAYLYDSKTLSQKVKWQPDEYECSCIEFANNSKSVITSSPTYIRLWRVEDLLNNKIGYIHQIPLAEDNYNFLWTLKAIPTSDPLVIFIRQGDITIWQIEPTQVIYEFKIPGKYVSGWYFVTTSDFGTLITAGDDKNLLVYQYASYDIGNV